jgi:hypothetical protein
LWSLDFVKGCVKDADFAFDWSFLRDFNSAEINQGTHVEWERGEELFEQIE